MNILSGRWALNTLCYYVLRDLAKAAKGGGAPCYFLDPPPHSFALPLLFWSAPFINGAFISFIVFFLAKNGQNILQNQLQ